MFFKKVALFGHFSAHMSTAATTLRNLSSLKGSPLGIEGREGVISSHISIFH